MLTPNQLSRLVLPSRRRAVRRGGSPSQAGFTLLELIVVVTMLGIIAALALPNLIQMPRRAKESVLLNNLQTIRKVLDQYYGDKGFYPGSLEVLEEEGYFRKVPRDPITESDEWGLVFEEGDADAIDDFGFGDDPTGGGEPGIIDVYSLSEDTSINGTPYSEW